MEPPETRSDRDLSRVISFEKRQELYNVLHSEDPCHYERLWMAGFLKFVGYTPEEICAIIDREACWADYDVRMTFLQVQSVFRIGSRRAACTCTCDRDHTLTGKTYNPFVKCPADTPCRDSMDGYCHIRSGKYHLPSVTENVRRAILCLIDHQTAKLQRQKARINALRALLLSVLFRRV